MQSSTSVKPLLPWKCVFTTPCPQTVQLSGPVSSVGNAARGQPDRSFRHGGAAQPGDQAIERIMAGKLDLKSTAVADTDLDRDRRCEQIR